MKGFDDVRGTMFFEVARILDYHRPKCFLLENVKQLVSHDKGRTFSTILRVLSDLGYSVQWRILNALDFGVPQKRERLIIVGFLDKRTHEICFTWQPHGSQFTIHEPVPMDAIKFSIRRPPIMNPQQVLDHIGFDADWVKIIR